MPGFGLVVRGIQVKVKGMVIESLRLDDQRQPITGEDRDQEHVIALAA